MAITSLRNAIFDVKKNDRNKNKQWKKQRNNVRNKSDVVLKNYLGNTKTGRNKIICFLADINSNGDHSKKKNGKEEGWEKFFDDIPVYLFQVTII